MKREKLRIFEPAFQYIGRTLDNLALWLIESLSKVPEEALKNFLREEGFTDEQIERYLQIFKRLKEG